MDLTENRTNNPNLITSAQPDQCVIGSQKHKKTIIIPSDGQVIEYSIESINELTKELIAQLCDYQPEVIILATGQHIEFPETNILDQLVSKNIGLEVLNNQAAARTFNVLLAESRKTVCLMIIKDCCISH